MKKFKKYGIIFALALFVFSVNTLKANARWHIYPTYDRFAYSDDVLKDNLGDDYGPATDKIIKEQNKMQFDGKIEGQNNAVHPISNIKPDNTRRIKVSNIVFSGNTVLKTADLNKFTTDIVGKEVTLADLYNLADRITDLYKKNGYITSIAVFDPQKMKDGNVEIKIVEGKIGNVNIQDNKWVRTSYVRDNLLKVNDLQSNKILNVNNINSSLTDLNGANYLKGAITLQENKTDITKTDLNVNVKDRFPIEITASTDNMGRLNVGSQRFLTNLSYNNLTGFGDKIYANTILGIDQFGLNTGYNLPIGPYGTEARFGYSLERNGTNGVFQRYNPDSFADLFRLSLIQPLYKNNHLYILTDMSFDRMHTETHYESDGHLFNRFNESVLRNGISTVENDKYGKLLSRFEVSTGIPILGAINVGGRGITSSSFVKFLANFNRTQNLPYEITGIFRLKGQFSPNHLMEYEALHVGGMDSVRGFDESPTWGDNGWIASIELQRTIPYLPNLSIPYWKNKTIPLNLKGKIKFALFYDQGYVHVIHIEQLLKSCDFLESVGAGLRIKLSKFMQADLDLGVPIGRDRYIDQSAVRFNFNIKSDLI